MIAGLSALEFDKEHKEGVYQEFFEQNPHLIPMHREGKYSSDITGDLVISQPRLEHMDIAFQSRKPDFMYISWTSRASIVVLVEIEKPQSKYFQDRSVQYHSDFSAAVSQINQWKQYFRKAGTDRFRDEYLAKIFRVNSYSGHPNNIQIEYLLVHGRRSDYAGSQEKANLLTNYENDNGVHIMPFCRLLDADIKNLKFTKTLTGFVDSDFNLKLLKGKGAETDKFKEDVIAKII